MKKTLVIVFFTIFSFPLISCAKTPHVTPHIKCDTGKSGKHILNRAAFDKFVASEKHLDKYFIVFSCTGKKAGDFVVGMIHPMVTTSRFGRNTFYFENTDKDVYKIYKYNSEFADRTRGVVKDNKGNDWIVLNYTYMKRGYMDQTGDLFSPASDKIISLYGVNSYNYECANEEWGEQFLDKVARIKDFSIHADTGKITFMKKEQDCKTKETKNILESFSRSENAYINDNGKTVDFDLKKTFIKEIK